MLNGAPKNTGSRERLTFFDRMIGRSAKKGPSEERIIFELDGTADPVEVIVRHHPRARRLSLRIDPALGSPIVTVPPAASARAAERFVHEHASWLLTMLSELPPSIPFADGSEIDVFGERLCIRHAPEKRTGVKRDGDRLLVSGREEHLPRRARDFLKREAKAVISPIAREMAGQIGEKVGRITLRDTRSRWGSCSAKGDLSFSWRLVLAPPEVLQYVVAHEVAHLRHMDHSPAFWGTVAKLFPNYRDSRDWLSENGAALHRIG